MGLIKSITETVVGAATSAVNDQYKEYVKCPTITNNVLIQRGVVHHGSGDKNPTEGIISNGSLIVVDEGMAMMLIDNGEIKEFTAEKGEYYYDTSSEPSIFTGKLSKSILDTLKVIGRRVSFGNQTARDQRVYYINLKVIPGNPFGSTQPERIFDPLYGGVEITYNGEYSLRVDDPIILVNNMIGANPTKDTLTYDDIFSSAAGNMLKSKFAQKVSEAISTIMAVNNVSFNRIQAYKTDVTDLMNKILDEDWHQKYGIIVEDVTLRINATEESRKIMQDMDADLTRTARMGEVYSNNMAGTMAAATAESMKNAAGNPNGAMMGFMGMNMGQMAGANVLGTVGGMQNNAQPTQEAPVYPMPGTIFATGTSNPEQPESAVETTTEETTVEETPVVEEEPVKEEIVQESVSTKKECPNCHEMVEGKFCSNCGSPLE